jgi:hypothetical protein
MVNIYPIGSTTKLVGIPSATHVAVTEGLERPCRGDHVAAVTFVSCHTYPIRQPRWKFDILAAEEKESVHAPNSTPK